MSFPFPAVLALAACASSVLADTITVGPSATDDFAEIQPAVDVAQPGDVIVVDGTGFPYAGFHAEKPLSIVSKTLARPRVMNLGGEPCVITNIGAGERFVVSNISFLSLDGLRVQDCDGLVVVHHAHMDTGTSRIRGAASLLLADTGQEAALAGQKAWPHFHFKDSTAWIVESTSESPSPLVPLASPIDYVIHELEESSVAYFGSAVRAADFALDSGAPGGIGVRATASTLELRRSHLVGGDGGTRDAGVAAELFGGSSLLFDPSSTLSAGVGVGAIPQEAVSVSPDSSVATELVASPTLATFPHALDEGELTITLHGEPGSAGTVLASVNVSPPWTHPAIEGALFLDRESVFALGQVELNASGTQALKVPIGGGPVFPGGVAVVQWIASGPAGAIASNPSLVYRAPSSTD